MRDWKEYLKEQKIEIVSIDAIKPYSNNPRLNEKAVPRVANSIERFGFRNPILVDKDGVIIEGHTRRLAALKLGMEQVPVVYATDLTQEEVDALRIIDNKTAEIAEWDMNMLAEEMAKLTSFDFGDFGFDVKNLMEMGVEDLGTKEDDDTYDYEEDENNRPKVQLRTQAGDIWRLGEHYLMCGDSTSEADVARLMDGKQADLLLTDPPYNVAIEGGTGMTIQNDNMGNAQFDAFLDAVFKRAESAMRPGAVFYVFHASRTQRAFENAMNKAGLEVRQQLIWAKESLVLGRQDYQWDHEPCFFGWKDGAAHIWNFDRKQTTVVDLMPNAMMKRKDGNVILKIGGKTYALKPDALVEELPGTVIWTPKPSRSELHPTMKPIALCKYLMENSSDYGDTVLDLFGGSGTTLMAAERAGRKCRMMELDSAYATVILNRWEAETGQQAVQIADRDGTRGHADPSGVPVEALTPEWSDSPKNN